jgi:Lon protease-like protein
MDPEPLPLFPLRTVLFPGMPLPLHIFEERYRLMIERVLAANASFGVVLIRSGEEVGEPAEPHPYGTTARIVSGQRLPDGRFRLLCRGEQRFRIERVIETRPYVIGEVVYLPEETGSAPPALIEDARTLWLEYMDLLIRSRGRRGNEPAEHLHVPEDTGALELSYLIAANLQVDHAIQQQLLEAETAGDRLRLAVRALRRELPILRLLQREDYPSADSSGRFSAN